MRVLSSVEDLAGGSVHVTHLDEDRVDIVYRDGVADALVVHVAFHDDKADVTMVRAGEHLRRGVPSDGEQDHADRSIVVRLGNPRWWGDVGAKLAAESSRLRTSNVMSPTQGRTDDVPSPVKSSFQELRRRHLASREGNPILEERRRAELERLYGLEDRWLGEALLTGARRTRERIAPDAPSVIRHLLWTAIPELAHRLGAKSVGGEVPNQKLRAAADWQLRGFVGNVLDESMRSNPYPSIVEDDHEFVSLLLRHPLKGSLLAIALDRVVPPTPPYADYCAREWTRVTSHWGADRPPVWHPGLQRRNALKDVAEHTVVADNVVPGPW